MTPFLFQTLVNYQPHLYTHSSQHERFLCHTLDTYQPLLHTHSSQYLRFVFQILDTHINLIYIHSSQHVTFLCQTLALINAIYTLNLLLSTSQGDNIITTIPSPSHSMMHSPSRSIKGDRIFREMTSPTTPIPLDTSGEW